MNTTPPQPWAESPYIMLPYPYHYVDENMKPHFCVRAAHGMVGSHNCLFRGLNALLQQGPHVVDSTQANYNSTDVRDLLSYILIWTKMVDHHHHTEETTIFPLVEEMAGEPIMSKSKKQHEAFSGGLHRLSAYCEVIKVHEYRWAHVQGIIDSFAPQFVEHLTEEIGDILSRDRYDNDRLRTVWAKVGKAAKPFGNLKLLYDVFPMVLGCYDTTFDGGNTGTGLPSCLLFIIRYGFAWIHRGAWRFNQCDMWGVPRPLQMLPENR